MDELPDPSDPLSTMAPAQPAVAVEEAPAPVEEPVAVTVGTEEDAAVVEEVVEEVAEPVAEPVPLAAEKSAAASGPQIRFAEEILVPDREEQQAPESKGRGRAKGKAKGKRSSSQEGPPTKVKRPARERVVVLEDADEYLDDDEV